MSRNIVSELESTQQQIGETDTLIPIFKLFVTNIQPSISYFEVVRQNIGHAFVVGHSTNGVIGTANGIDGSQITIGTGGLGASTLHYSG